MTMAPAALQAASGSGTRVPSLRAQLHATLGLYEALTKLYFVLIELQTATAQAQARQSLEAQTRELRAFLIGSDGSNASAARSGADSNSTGALKKLSPSHAERVRKLAVLRPLLPQGETSGTTSSIISASTPTIPAVAVAIDTVEEILAELVDRGRRHAANQSRIEALVKGIDGRQTQLVATMEQLARLREQAAKLVKVGAEEETVMNRAEEHPLDFEEILKYGRTLSQTTRAPSGFKLKLQEEDDDDEDAADVQVNGQPGDAQEDTGERKRPLLSLGEDEQDGQKSNKRAATQIPPHLQDKLPFPSVDAMRRSASEVVMPTWEQFQQGQLAQSDGQDADEAAPQSGADAGQAVEKMPPPSAATAGQMRMPVGEVRAKPPADDEDEGFGLDLN